MPKPFNFEPEAVAFQEIFDTEDEIRRRRAAPLRRPRARPRPRPRFPAPRSWPFLIPYPWPVPPLEPPPAPFAGSDSAPSADTGASAEPPACPCPCPATGAEPSAEPLPDAAAQEFWAGEDEMFADEIYHFAGLEPEDPLQGFTGPEHRDIGDLALSQEKTIIAYGDSGQRLTFGEVIALAGDYFGTYEELRDLAQTRQGRAQIAWARWDALNLPKSSEPNVPAQVKEVVRERYYVLASNNVPHFSAGGAARQTYVKWHSQALSGALQAGQENKPAVWRIALTKEAFGAHFLTDAFAAGHVRTPRQQMREWYGRYFRNSTKDFVHYMAKFMYDDLNKRHRVPLHLRALERIAHIVTATIEKRIKKLGGEAINSFSLGDIVSLALHDLDNRGLQVVAEVDPNGNKIAGGYRWRAIGDSHLGTGPGEQTKAMVVNALKTSIKELQQVMAAGRANPNARGLDLIKRTLGGATFAALAFVPKEDRAAIARSGGPSPQDLEWRWGRLGRTAYQEVDKTVKSRIATELGARSQDIDDSSSGIRGIRAAFNAFVAHLQRDGIRALERAVKRKAR
jgi:hypothetical protein